MALSATKLAFAKTRIGQTTDLTVTLTLHGQVPALFRAQA